MSVGKESIKRAASAGTRKSTVKVLAEEVKAAAESKAAVEVEKNAAPVKKTGRTKTATVRKTTAKTAKTVKTSVLTPVNAEDIYTKVLSSQEKNDDTANQPVHITEELPVYLL